MPTINSLLAELGKNALEGDPSARLVLEHPITGVLLKAIMETPIPAYIRFDVPYTKLILKDGKRRIIHGYASVEMIDKQQELITIPALQKAWNRMKTAGEKYANINLEHSNITIGKILLDEKVKDSDGQNYWSHVDDKGLYIVAELRDDIEIADKAWSMANKGELNAYSIGGRALKKRLVHKNQASPFFQIDDLELYEVTVCKRGKNRLSGFEVLKSYLEHGLINQETFLQKSAELKRSETIIKELAFLPKLIGKQLILRKDFVCQVGSSVEKGQGHDFDLLVKMDTDNSLRRHIETRLLKAVPPDLWDRMEFTFGDEAGPHDTFRPLFDLALVPSNQYSRVDMTKGEKTLSDEQSGERSNRTLKNVVERKTGGDETMSHEEKKAEGTPELSNTGTGPKEGAVSGTSTTGPAIASLQARVKKLEEDLAKAKPDEEEEKPEEEEEEKKQDEEAQDEDDKKKPPYPLADEEEKKGDIDPEVFTALEGLAIKGKLPKGLKDWMSKQKKAEKGEDTRIADLEAKVEKMGTDVASILKAVTKKEDDAEEKKSDEVKKSDSGLSEADVKRIAKETSTILKSEATSVKKSDATPSITPDGSKAEKPLTLQDMKKMPWTDVHDLDQRRRALALGGQ